MLHTTSHITWHGLVSHRKIGWNVARKRTTCVKEYLLGLFSHYTSPTGAHTHTYARCAQSIIGWVFASRRRRDERWWHFCPWAHCLRLNFHAEEFTFSTIKCFSMHSKRHWHCRNATNITAIVSNFENDVDAKSNDSNGLDELWVYRPSRIQIAVTV